MSLHTPHCTVICFFTFAFSNSMPPTNSSPDDIVCTTIILALTSLCAMSATYSFSQCLVSASFLATPLPLSPPMSVTKSSILGNIGTTFMATDCFYTVSPTMTSPDDVVGTSFMAANTFFYKLLCLAVAPCLIQTPPFWARLVHPS